MIFNFKEYQFKLGQNMFSSFWMLNFHEKDTVRDSVEFELAQQLHDRVDEKRHLDIDGKK